MEETKCLIEVVRTIQDALIVVAVCASRIKRDDVDVLLKIPFPYVVYSAESDTIAARFLPTSRSDSDIEERRDSIMLFCMACAVEDTDGVALPAKTVIFGMAVCVKHISVVVEFEGALSMIARKLNPEMIESKA